jgi:hypothetical protein
MTDSPVSEFDNVVSRIRDYLASEYRRGQAVVTWTPELFDKLRRLICTEHLSAAQAAKSLSEETNQPITKNMVISKCGRSGITIPRRFLRPFEIEEIRNSTESCRALAQRFGVLDSCVSKVRNEEARPTLNPFPADVRGCLWPRGHPSEPGFYFCGAHRLPGKPYCSSHSLVAYVRSTGKVGVE